MINTRILTICILLEEITLDEVITWSDAKIKDGSEEEVFVELSSFGHVTDKNKVLESLNGQGSNISKNDFDVLSKLLFSYWNKDLDNWKIVQSKLVRFHDYFSEYFAKKDYEFWSRVKDDYYLRKDGFSGSMKMPFELRLFFESNDLEEYSLGFFETLIRTLGNG